MRNNFDRQLSTLNNELIAMGALCEEAIGSCAEYLIGGDSSMRGNAIEAEKLIDQKERDIEALCMKLLMQQQPVAKDLRTISSALKMISDMERIGDQASDIAEIARYVAGCGIYGEVHIADMAKATIKMVTESIDSFVKKNIDLARSVIVHDDIVDNLFAEIKGELIAAVQNRSANAETLIDLLMIAKYFERIGDHAVNIAEWVIFSITGKHADSD